MRSFWRLLLFASCTATLLGVAGCGHRSAVPKQTMQVPSANVAKEQLKKPAASPPSGTTKAAPQFSSPSAVPSAPPAAAQSATLDERLVVALKPLGSQQGPRGEVLHL